ncbi:DgyrCDS13778 [Dimorphilus gyrociliatus]|uniref:DgyrCDS13778 n=1 Tax=Dimorphilus gyrociliatus TaxID=2664684 RepID=A0A7I8WBP2_9ANNE|nr:DgyrCDS13778 [Dimorphilus gyrociliatus]
MKTDFRMTDSLRLQQKFQKGQKLTGIVSHVDSLSSFYVQVSPYNEFEDLQQKIQAYCEGITSRCFLAPKKGSIALGQYEGSWYRAKILDACSNKSEILFVDFGNKSIVSQDQMISLPPQYKELPFQAIHCNLNLSRGFDKQDAKAIDKLVHLTENDEITLEVREVGSKSSLHLIDMYLKGEPVANQLFEGLCNGKPPCTLTCEDEITDSSKPTKESLEVVDNDQPDRKISKGEQEDAATSNKSDKTTHPAYALLKLPTPWLNGLTKRVIVTAYENHFLWCIDEGDAEAVNKLSQNINKYYKESQELQSLSAKIKVGDVFCANDGDNWLRVTVLDELPGGNYEVQDIDFGKQFILKKDRLYILEENFVWQPRCCRKMMLFNRGLVLNEDIVQNIMRKLICSRSRVQIKIEKTEEDIHFVSVTIKSLDLLNDILALPKAVCTLKELMEKFKDFAIDCTLPTNLPRKLNAYVSHVESMTEFYIQPSTWEKKLEEITNTLNIIYTKQGQCLQLLKAEKGMFCVARYSEDDCYYRAKILSCEETKAIVHFIDFGNYDEVSISQLFVLVDQLTSRSQCIKCSLNNVKESVPMNTILEMMNEKLLKCEYYIGSDCFVADMWENEKHLNHIFSPDLATVNEIQAKKSSIDLYPVEYSLDRQNAKLLHVDNPSIFFVSPPPAEKQKAEVNNLFEDCNMTRAPVLDNASPGQICAIKVVHPDLEGVWFRGKILEVRGNKSRVRLLDEGKAFICNNDEIRVLPPSLLVKPACAVECHLIGLQVPENGWTKTEKKSLISAYPPVHSQVFVVFKNKAGGLLRTDLYSSDGKNTARVLEEIRLSLSENKREKIQAESTGSHKSSKSGQNGLSQSLVSQPLKKLMLNVKYEAFVSHYENPANIWIHLQEDEESIASLNAKLHTACSKIDSNQQFKEGELCCAFSVEFSAWYRCVIIRLEDQEADVRYIDFGNREKVSSKQLAPIDKSFLAIPPYATKICIVNEYTEDESNKLNETLGEECLIVKILTTDEPYNVEISTENISNIREAVFGSPAKLGQESSAVTQEIYPEEENKAKMDDLVVQDHKPLSCDVQVYVSYVESPTKFWIQLVSETDEIENILISLRDADSMENLKDIEVGMYCIAKSNADGTWYRAQVIKFETSAYEVIYIDYGNTEIVQLENLRVINSSLTETYKLAISASLLSVVEPTGGWKPEKIALFEEKVLGKELTCRVCSTSSPIEVILADGDDCLNALYLSSSDSEETLSTYPCQIIPSTEEKGRIVHVNKKGDIFFQLYKDDDDLNLIFGLLEDITKYPVVETVVNNSPVLALFEGEWFRALITRSEPVIDVFFVDYGNSSSVEPRDLRMVNNEILSYPPLAYCFKDYASAQVTDQTIENLLEIEDIDVSFSEKPRIRLDDMELMEAMWLKDKNICTLRNSLERENSLSGSKVEESEVNESELEEKIRIFENTYEDISETSISQNAVVNKGPVFLNEIDQYRQASAIPNSPNYEAFKDMSCMESTRVDEVNSTKEESCVTNETGKTLDISENTEFDVTEEYLVKELVSEALINVYNCLTLFNAAHTLSTYKNFPLSVGQQFAVEVISLPGDNILILKSLQIPSQLLNIDGENMVNVTFEMSIPALALTKDNNWVRVTILQAKNGICQVCSVDHGYIFETETKALKVIEDKEILSIPVQVFVCKTDVKSKKFQEVICALNERKKCLIDIKVEAVDNIATVSIASVVVKDEVQQLNNTIKIEF